MEELKKELEKLSKAYVDTPENEEKILIFLRSCDMHAVRRLDEIYLNNGGFEDIYYKKIF